MGDGSRLASSRARLSVNRAWRVNEPSVASFCGATQSTAEKMQQDAERYARVKTIFLGAVELPEERRATFLAEACGDDVELRDEVLALLRHFRPSDLLDGYGGR